MRVHRFKHEAEIVKNVSHFLSVKGSSVNIIMCRYVCPKA